MATAGRQSLDAETLAADLRAAGLVRLAPAPTGDSVAAAGVLARSFRAIDLPYQISVETGDERRNTEADVTIALDRTCPGADETLGDGRPASAAAFELADSLAVESTCAPVAAAGVLAAGEALSGPIAEAVADAGIERRPGVAGPTDDLADVLAHSTRLHAPFSGDPDAVRDTLDGVTDPDDEETRRRIASRVALLVTNAEDAPARAADAVADALRPHVGGPLVTLEGYADVLDAAVRDDPGAAVALAIGHDAARAAALDAWRRHARRAHEALHAMSISRHAGLVVAEADGPIETVARLLRDFKSPEPLALLDGGDRIALAASEQYDATSVLESATASFDLSGRVTGGSDLATQSYPGEVETLLTAVREVIRDA